MATQRKETSVGNRKNQREGDGGYLSNFSPKDAAVIQKAQDESNERDQAWIRIGRCIDELVTLYRKTEAGKK